MRQVSFNKNVKIGGCAFQSIEVTLYTDDPTARQAFLALEDAIRGLEVKLDE